MWIVAARASDGGTSVYGPFEDAQEAQRWADYFAPQWPRIELVAFPVLVPPGIAPATIVPHPSIVAEARRQAKANACTDPFFLKGRCTQCGTSIRRHAEGRKG
jgi:hypothetical protein